ncbi:MAG TPA: UDP-glucose/GDP-mannose dehydrogenase family protein [Thermoplasmata archaeon]|nr:UDP-glucose/GDP-mannose dehydrogenase family protein [Thermoplasmata archaeon]
MADKSVCVIGCNVVGLTTGVVLASFGHRVRFVEGDRLRLSGLRRSELPFFEPGLSTMLANGLRKRRISIEEGVDEAVDSSDFIFLAVQIPLLKSSSPNISPLRDAAKTVGKSLDGGETVIQLSAAPPGTAEDLLIPILESQSDLTAGKEFGVAVSPEFLRRGTAVQDCLKPSRIIVGANSKRTATGVMGLYNKLDAPKLIMDLRTAETVKLVSDCFLATKMSFVNEIAGLCERFGVDEEEVMKGVRLDPRIGTGCTDPGLGFGGSGLPNNLSITISAGESAGMKPELLKTVRKINDRQPMRAIRMLEEELGSLRGKRIALLGLAFKAGVDDISESRAFPIAVELLARGAKVVGYDPLAKASFIRALPGISYASSTQEALLEADGCVIQTEEKEFSKLGKSDFDLMKNKLVVDGRRIVSPAKLKKYGVTLRAIGLGRKT